jgi:catalase
LACSTETTRPRARFGEIGRAFLCIETQHGAQQQHVNEAGLSLQFQIDGISSIKSVELNSRQSRKRLRKIYQRCEWYGALTPLDSRNFKEVRMAGSGSALNPSPLKAVVVIGATIGVAVIAFAHTAGWLTPDRLTPTKLVAALQSPKGPALGHRRNHAKGICFTGTFDANGEGSELSKAKLFERGQYPVVGRFNIGGADPKIPDPMAQVRGLGIRITSIDGQEWRSAMIDAPVFAAPTPRAFFEFLTAISSKDPNAFKQYSSAHSEILTFISWVKDHSRTESWTEDRFNSLDSFVFIDKSGAKNVVRWSFIPSAKPATISSAELAKRDPDFLEEDIIQRVDTAPQRWNLMITVANPGDPTSDPTRAWPADRRSLDVGTLTVRQISPEVDGPCRDINFDPTVLPAGITMSDDPFPAARSAAYRVSFNGRMAESSHYPHTQTGGKQ